MSISSIGSIIQPAARFSELQTKLNSKNASMAVVGLGYVGLPLAVEFAR